MVNATDDITVQLYDMMELSTDATTVLPVEALGTAYHLMTYLFLEESVYIQGPSILCVVATEDRTTVTLEFPSNDLDVNQPSKFGIKYDGQQMSFTMDKYETLQVYILTNKYFLYCNCSNSWVVFGA